MSIPPRLPTLAHGIVFAENEDAVSYVLTTGRDMLRVARPSLFAKIGFKTPYNDFDVVSAYICGLPIIVGPRDAGLLSLKSVRTVIPSTEVYEYRVLDKFYDNTIRFYLQCRVCAPVHIFKLGMSGRLLNVGGPNDSYIKLKYNNRTRTPVLMPRKLSIPLSISMAGRCSSVAAIIGMNHLEWVTATRQYASVFMADYLKFPLEVVWKDGNISETKINGHAVNVSGHVMYAVLTAVIRGPIIDSGLNGVYDLFGALHTMLVINQFKPYKSFEPSFDDPAWHSWFEIAAGFIAGIRAICLLMKYGDIRIKKLRAVYALLTIRKFWRRITPNSRTSIDAVIPGANEMDLRFSG